MDLGIKGKYALVTGGSHGIGRAIALALADEGCNVAICARDESCIESVVREIEARGVEGLGVEGDVRSEDCVEAVMGVISREWGKLCILVNNVGGGGRWGSDKVDETPENVWLDVYNKNAVAAIRFTMRVVPLMMKQKWGRVVTVASLHGREGGGRPWFTMAKSAEIALMKSLAMDKRFARKGITFNSVAPGPIMIPNTGWEQEYKKKPITFWRTIKREFPQGRMGTPEEVANVVAFLCSERASLINGACVAVDGGYGRSF